MAFSGLLVPRLSGQGLPDVTFRNINIWPEKHGAIQVLEDSEGYLWMTSALGVHRYDGREVHSYFHQADTLSLAANYTEMLFEDNLRRLWIGTTSGDIDLYDRARDCFRHVITRDRGIVHPCRMIQDGQGTLWITAGNGLFSMDPENYALTKFIPDNVPTDPSGFGFRGIAKDTRDPDWLWVAGLDGAYHFSRITHQFESLHVPHRQNEKQYMLMDISQKEPGKLYCGAWFGGLMSYDIAARQWTVNLAPDFGDGRWYDVVKATMPFDKNRLWIAGGDGFGVFSIPDHQFLFYPFDNSTGLDSSFSFAGIAMTKQSNVVVTSLTGFSISTALDSDNVGLSYAPAIGSLSLDGRPYSSDTASAQLRSIFLDEREKDIAFTIITPGNYSTERVEYRYQLEGYDKEWLTQADNHIVRYTNLPGGKYMFRFGARIGEQDWVNGRAVSIEKTVSLYESPWLYVVCACVLAGIFLLLYRIRLQHLKAERLKAEYNQKLADTEMALLRSQMNPHFIFNSLNSIKYYILNEEPENANKYLTKFSKLMRLVLKNSQSKLVNLAEELEALQLYIELESLRFKEEFNYAIHVDSAIDQGDTYIPPLIIQPYVENAIWHGLLQKEGPGNLDVQIDRSNGTLHIQVTDNGIGRKAADALRSKSATKKSFGTRITHDRIALVREFIGVDASVVTYDLRDGTGNASGTRVVIDIPLLSGDRVTSLNLN